MNAPTVTIVPSLAEPEAYRRRLVPCRCGAHRPDDVPEGWHAPHHALVDGRLRIVNCKGEVLT